MKCPSEETLLRHLLGELSVNESKTVETHIALCPACRSLHAGQCELVQDLAAKDPGLDSDEAYVRRVLDSCAQASPATHREHRASRWIAWTTPLAAAAAVALCVGGYGYVSSARRHGEGFVARGAPRRAPSDDGLGKAGAAVLVVRGTTSLPVQDAVVQPGSGFTVRYWNNTTKTRYLTAFAVDAEGAVHWLFPAYDVPGSAPVSIPLSPSEGRLLEEVVEPDAPASGPMKIVAIVSPAPLQVKALDIEVEREGVEALVQRVSKDASVQQWRCTWTRK